MALKSGRRGAECQAKKLRWTRYWDIVEDFKPQRVTHICLTQEGEVHITLVADWS